jgi:hypothetical protein
MFHRSIKARRVSLLTRAMGLSEPESPTLNSCATSHTSDQEHGGSGVEEGDRLVGGGDFACMGVALGRGLQRSGHAGGSIPPLRGCARKRGRPGPEREAPRRSCPVQSRNPSSPVAFGAPDAPSPVPPRSPSVGLAGVLVHRRGARRTGTEGTGLGRGVRPAPLATPIQQILAGGELADRSVRVGHSIRVAKWCNRLLCASRSRLFKNRDGRSYVRTGC